MENNFGRLSEKQTIVHNLKGVNEAHKFVIS